MFGLFFIIAVNKCCRNTVVFLEECLKMVHNYRSEVDTRSAMIVCVSQLKLLRKDGLSGTSYSAASEEV